MTLEQRECSRMTTMIVHQLHIGAVMRLFCMGKRQCMSSKALYQKTALLKDVLR